MYNLMNYFVGLSIIVLYIASISEVKAIILYRSPDDCSSSDVTFICTNNDGPALYWLVNRESNGPNFNWNVNFDLVGSSRTNRIAGSFLITVLEYGNASFISTTLVINKPFNLQSFSITCNENTIIFNVPKNYLAPAELNLVLLYKDGDICAFNATWAPSPPQVETYNISVALLPPYEPVTWLTNGSKTNVNITEGIFYEVTLSTCPYKMTSSRFTVGILPILWKLGYQLKYTFYVNGSTTVSCRNNNAEEELWIHCEDIISNEESVLCTNESNGTQTADTTTTEVLKMSSFSVFSNASNDVSKNVTTSGADCSSSSHGSSSRMAASMGAMAGIVLTFIITATIPIFVCGYLCGATSMKKKLHMKFKLKSWAEDPVYDEVGPPPKERLSTLQNVAYGNTVP